MSWFIKHAHFISVLEAQVRGDNILQHNPKTYTNGCPLPFLHCVHVLWVILDHLAAIKSLSWALLALLQGSAKSSPCK